MIDQVWQDRWDALNTYIQELLVKCQNLEEGFPRKDTIYVTLQCLQEFGKGQFDFFSKGFSNGSLVDSIKFPNENALAATLDQISYDIAVLEKSIEQRKTHNDVLRKADYLAYEAIKPILPQPGIPKDFVMREPTTVLTYFQKSTSVRIIPYAPIVIVGIPFTCLVAREDFLAIPHEVGHYVFQHGRVNIKILNDLSRAGFKGFDELTKTWFEELFADVYGALVAGPVIGLSFQDLQMTKISEEFYIGDGEHPVPILRPYIYMHVYNAGEEKLKNWTEKLRKNWESYLSERDENIIRNIHDLERDEPISDEIKNDFVQNRIFKSADAEESKRISEQISIDFKAHAFDKPIDKAINILRQNLLGDIEQRCWPPSLEAPKQNETVDDLYEKFAEYIASIPPQDQVIPELSLGQDLTIFVGDDNELGNTNRKKGNTGLAMEVTKKSVLIDNAPKSSIQPEDWLKVLDAGGWTVKGPDCEASGGVCAG